MTPQEFKAWFEGFTENIKGEPSTKQWARIKERVSQINGKTITREVVREYWPRWYPYYTNVYGVAHETLSTTPSKTEIWCQSDTSGSINTVTSATAFLTQVGRSEAVSL